VRISFLLGALGWEVLNGNLLDRLYWLTFLATLTFLFFGPHLVQLLSVTGRQTSGELLPATPDAAWNVSELERLLCRGAYGCSGSFGDRR
jgi:hypothetical protein